MVPGGVPWLVSLLLHSVFGKYIASLSFAQAPRGSASSCPILPHTSRVRVSKKDGRMGARLFGKIWSQSYELSDIERPIQARAPTRCLPSHHPPRCLFLHPSDGTLAPLATRAVYSFSLTVLCTRWVGRVFRHTRDREGALFIELSGICSSISEVLGC